VSYEAKQRVTSDESLARLLDKQMLDSGTSFLRVVDQNCQRMQGEAVLMQVQVDRAIDETQRVRSAQEDLLKVVRQDHHDAMALLHKSLDETKMSTIEFEGRFAGDMRKSVGALDDRITLDLSIQHRVSTELVTEVRTALSKRTKAEEQYEANIGLQMLRERELHMQLGDCSAKRRDAFSAFAETMDNMVHEVHDAVKKMNLSRGSELLMPRRHSRAA
jgi:hypothetical protein